MKWNFEVAGITRSERIVTRIIAATTPQVAKDKMRRKIKGITGLRVYLAAEQPLTEAQKRGLHELVCEKAGI